MVEVPGLLNVEGRKQLAATMRKAGADMGDLSAANREVAGIVTPEAAAGAPHRTGRLAASMRGSGTRAAARVVSPLVYSPVIHYGWPARGIPARPFAFQAAQHTEPAWTETYNQRIDEILSKIKGV